VGTRVARLREGGALGPGTNLVNGEAMRRLLASVAAVLSLFAATSSASAGIIQDENAKPGIAGGWAAGNDGTARFDGVVDLYPAKWSIARGDTIKLKVRSTTGYDVRVMRLGYYGGSGAREVKLVSGQPPSPQQYPVADPKYGMAEAKWADSVSIPTDDSWTPGLYVARAEQPGGKNAVTFFTIRDDGMPKMPILFVVGVVTHAAYNAWPGMDRGGKSLYGFNSSPTHATDSIRDLAQAVRVSLDRPFFVGGGTADVGGYEYPFLRWLESRGYDVAVATDLDLHENPDIAKGRRVVTFSGHEEYTTWEMFDNAIAARDSGTNFLFLSGDTWSWQVRLEGQTVIGYKESWVKDPEQREAFSLREAGNIDEAKKHFRRVSRGWKNLEYDPTRGIDERRPGMTLTGVQSSGIIRDASGNPMHGGLYPWADLVVDAPTFWIYEGTGLKGGDKIPNVFGYEVDSPMRGSPEFDKFRPVGQVRFGTIKQVSDGTPKGATGYYQKDLGGGKRVEVVAMSAIYVAWGLDDWAAKQGGHTSVSPALDKMMTNVFKRWTGADPIPPAEPPPETGGTDPGSGYDPEKNGDPASPGTNGGSNNNAGATSDDKGGCSIGSTFTSSDRWLQGLAAIAIAAVALGARRRSRAG